jgi:Ca2+-binding RTX toxin-like protein
MATVIGTDTNNWLAGTGGGDLIKGFGGDDTLKGGGGADQLYGGTGIDTALYADSPTGVMIQLTSGYGVYGTAQGDRLYSIENVYGSGYNDIFYGNAGTNQLYGLSGFDTITGGGGGDMLDGGDGDDFLSGDAGADTLIGGTGTDTADYLLSPGAVYVSLIDNFGLFNDAHGDTFSGIERVVGSAWGDDTLIGDDGANILDGWDGSDRLEGRGGADLLDGNFGADTMIGGSGDDTYIVDDAADVVTEAGGQGSDTVVAEESYVLTAGADVETLATADDAGTAAIDLTGNANGNSVRGNDGSNVLSGGDGRDDLTGRGGNDWFRFDTPLGDTNVDVINDLNVAGNDTIVLENTIFGAFAAGPLAEERFVTTAPQQGNDNIIYDAASGHLFYDSDGNGPAAMVLFARMTPGTAVTHEDFLVV